MPSKINSKICSNGQPDTSLDTYSRDNHTKITKNGLLDCNNNYGLISSRTSEINNAIFGQPIPFGMRSPIASSTGDNGTFFQATSYLDVDDKSSRISSHLNNGYLARNKCGHINSGLTVTATPKAVDSSEHDLDIVKSKHRVENTISIAPPPFENKDSGILGFNKFRHLTWRNPVISENYIFPTFLSSTSNFSAYQKGKTSANGGALAIGDPPTPVSEKGTVSGFNADFKENPLALNDTRCVVSQRLFIHLRYMFETAYGLILKRDLCGLSKNSFLPLYGFPRRGVPMENAVYVNCLPSMIYNIIQWLTTEKVVSLIIVPVWSEHLWYKYLMKNATHRFIVSIDNDVSPNGQLASGMHAFILDTRYLSRATDIITVSVPSIVEMTKVRYCPHQILGMQSAEFLKARPKAHLSVAWFLKWGKTVPPPLLKIVLVGTHVGFRTHYRGGGEILRNYASELKEVEEEKAIQTAQKAVKKGWAAGPFDLPPFPNPECAMQAIITKMFTIPKHKWISDGELRLIFHKSFPLGLSINSLTPRHDAASFFPKGLFKYLTLARIMTIIAKAGRGSLMTIFDAQDAYKQLLVHIADLFQQVFMAGGKYYVDFCASFGSLYGSDSYSCFAYVHCVCLALAARLSVLEVYVDNYFKLTPFNATQDNTARIAVEEDERMKSELHNSGIHIHQFEGPTTRVTFIGWVIDTIEMTVSIPAARKSFMIAYLEQWQGMTTFSHKELSSLIGLLIFISQVVGGLKSTIGILLEKKTQMSRSATSMSIMSDRLTWAVTHILFILRRWKGVAHIYDRCWHDNRPDVVIFCDVAIGDTPKAGGYGKGGFALPSKKWFTAPWTEAELKEAMREKKHSSTHLEVLNMLEAVLFFTSRKQRVLCINDNTSAVRIAIARYSASANDFLKKRLNEFDLECCERDISVRFRHVKRDVEPFPVADALSRGQVVEPTNQPGRMLAVRYLRIQRYICLFV